MKRLDGKPKKKWKWSKEQLANHRSHKYYGLDQSAIINWACCHNRIRIGKVNEIQWPRTREGYIAFLKELGPKPNDGQKWSVGRKNHKKGYVKGNIRWELHKFNSAKRRGTKQENNRRAIVKLNHPIVYKFKCGSKAHKEQLARALRKRWRDPLQRQHMSELMKGNKHATKTQETGA